MKYMGHKGKMLPLLSDIVKDSASNAKRIADPFCGSAAVSWFLAENFDKEIYSGDLQKYATVRAQSVVERLNPIDGDILLKNWFRRANRIVNHVSEHFPNSLNSIKPEFNRESDIRSIVYNSRNFCRDVMPVAFQGINGSWPISKAYGGYYFSPYQALVFDALRQTLPRESKKKALALSALIDANSRAAASPGHTAQPFQPTDSASKYIVEAWNREPWELVKTAVQDLTGRTAMQAGKAINGGFEKTISFLEPGDFVFADPPYSAVHYSRFYHVLETITNGKEFIPEGRGRYPPIEQRPSSDFSKKTTAFAAAKDLIDVCAEKELGLILTFPTGKASNGLSTEDFVKYGEKRFSTVKIERFESSFSTLGGNKVIRDARAKSDESIVVFSF